MAKNSKPKPGTKPVGDPPPRAESNTVFTPKKTLTDLLKAARSLKSDTDDLTTAYSGQVREASQKKHLHVKAYNTIKMLDRMTPEKLADFMEHFDYYFEASGLEERAQSAPRLEGVGGVAKEPDDFEDDKTKDKGANGGLPVGSQAH